MKPMIIAPCDSKGQLVIVSIVFAHPNPFAITGKIFSIRERLGFLFSAFCLLFLFGDECEQCLFFFKSLDVFHFLFEFQLPEFCFLHPGLNGSKTFACSFGLSKKAFEIVLW